MAGMVLKAIGGLLIVLGTIWALQGLGIVTWPANSFMLARREWALYGGITALVGAAVGWVGIRAAAAPRR